MRNTIIIGSGPAGYTAAIYASRARLEPLLITGYAEGGQLMMTTDVENFPGYKSGVSGYEMMDDMKKQAKRFGTEFMKAEVKEIKNTTSPYLVCLDNGEEIETKTVIIATGAQSIWLNLDGEAKLRSNGISTCATCDGAFFRDEEIIVIGGGDSAMEEANFLTRFASTVTIVHRREEFKSSKIMLERAKENQKIKWMTSSSVKEWKSDSNGKLSGAVIRKTNGDEVELNCKGAFIAIGHKPNTSFTPDALETDNNGYIVQKDYTMTNLPGIFSCGDVSDTRYKQAITAAGQGCQAAIDVEKWLEEQ